MDAVFFQHNRRFNDQIYCTFLEESLLILWCSLRWIQIQNRQSAESEFSYGCFKIQLQTLKYDVSALTGV